MTVDLLKVDLKYFQHIALSIIAEGALNFILKPYTVRNSIRE